MRPRRGPSIPDEPLAAEPHLTSKAIALIANTQQEMRIITKKGFGLEVLGAGPHHETNTAEIETQPGRSPLHTNVPTSRILG